MVWITMSLDPHVETRKRENLDSKPHSQVNKCLNEKRRREQENIHIEELAELLSASPSDMSSLSCKPDKCAILKETVNQIRSQKQSTESDLSDDLQQSEVSSSKPNIINNNIFGSILLEALEGFLFVVNIEGKVEFVSENITSFLKYRQDDVYEKNVYDFIHPDDKSRFNNNLLLMMPLGNGRDWSSEGDFNSPGKPTKHFNCRFLVKQEKPEIKMENKPPPMPQYENLSITANYIPLGDDGSNDIRNGLTCIARRVNVEEKRIVVNKVEQFTTRIEQEGKVLDIDTSMLSSSSGQYLREELLNANVFDFCHPSDVATLKQHFRDTLEEGVATCVPFKFRVGRDRYARIKTKSKRFLCLPGVEEEFIISTHSIIRDCENTMELPKSSPSPSSFASTSSGPGSVSDSSTSINGSIALSPLTISNSYGNYPTSVSTSNNSELGLGELVLDIFPGSGWTLDPINTQSRESDCTSAASYVSSPQTAPASNISSDTSTAVSPTNSAFVPGLTSSRSGSSAPSPTLQSRVPTPFGGSCYSPSASQSSSGKSSPPRALPAKADSLNCSSTESSGNISLSQGMRQQDRQYDMKSNQKLRNLLTQSADDSMLRHSLKQTSQDEVTVLSESRIVDDPPRLARVNVEGQNIPRTSNNVILRDLLNQEDEDSDAPVEPIVKNVESSVPNPMLSVGSCKVTEGSSSQQRVGSNNMLRQLLNDAIDDRSYRQPQDLIHQLLIAGSGSKTPLLQSDKIKQENAPSPHVAETSVPKQVSVESNRCTPDVTFLSETATLKRKSTGEEST
ncbi:nuclear receptor coactivator 1-like isoform X3 [Stegodyphus dumicola]|uniref:nuclear receptor coactivator 1-like isoform X3 n=2 Tax=Stegodyphus dumicola TaxID=202533 RepID=UPI0015AE0EFB|nr:nuclear receptor coactivator 1-like isoform X3 [Stegodyphus dumicola]XP_035211758.1 nuclear receptor coactivator 1-like isoform X3 [Stegodyphus dumicola]